MIEFLHRVLAVFRDYFGTFDENSMKDNFSTVYQVLPRSHCILICLLCGCDDEYPLNAVIAVMHS